MGSVASYDRRVPYQLIVFVIISRLPVCVETCGADMDKVCRERSKRGIQHMVSSVFILHTIVEHFFQSLTDSQ
jgi:hypothetical protein